MLKSFVLVFYANFVRMEIASTSQNMTILLVLVLYTGHICIVGEGGWVGGVVGGSRHSPRNHTKKILREWMNGIHANLRCST